jgi:hypothetical protein
MFERLAAWCSWRCPLFALVLVLAAHLFHTPTWWRWGCDAMVGLAIALLFCSFGLSFATTAVLVERRQTRMERVGLAAGVVGGAALVAVGLLGAWALMSGTIRSS